MIIDEEQKVKIVTVTTEVDGLNNPLVEEFEAEDNATPEQIDFDFLNNRIAETKNNNHKEALTNFLASTPKPSDYPVGQDRLEFAINHVKNIMNNCI